MDDVGVKISRRENLETDSWNLLLHVIVTGVHLLPPQHLQGQVEGGRDAGLQGDLGSAWPVGGSTSCL